MSLSRWAFGLFLFLSLSGGGLAQDLYVSNRPFKGEVAKSSGGILVELEPFLTALKMKGTVEGGAISINGKIVAVTTSASGKSMVLLPEFAAAAGLTVRKNADFGHTDVYASTSAPSGDWSTTASASGGPSQSQGGADYTIKIPADYKMINDPKVMKAVMGMAAEEAGREVPDGLLSFEFVVGPAEGSTRKGLLMMMKINLPGAIPPGQDEAVNDLLRQALEKKGKILAGPTPYAIGGAPFRKYLMKSQDAGGPKMMESYVHVASAEGKIYWLALLDDEATYSTSFGALRNIVDTFRLK